MVRGVSIEVFDYLDYREFLRAYYTEKKAQGRGFSYRAFSKRAGLKSPNYLKLVIDDQRNLTAGMAARFAAACGLSGDAADYFTQLVAFNQAKTSTESADCYRRLARHRGFRKAQPLDLAHAAYHGEWYIPAIRELMSSSGFQDDPDWIAQQMLPKVSRAEAVKALEVLQQLGLASRDEAGKWVQTDELVSTGPETAGTHIGEYHRAILRKAAESIDLIASSERDISSLTFCLDDATLLRIKERISDFRKELLAMSTEVEDPDRVVQLNFQLFPLTRGAKEPE